MQTIANNCKQLQEFAKKMQNNASNCKTNANIAFLCKLLKNNMKILQNIAKNNCKKLHKFAKKNAKNARNYEKNCKIMQK